MNERLLLIVAEARAYQRAWREHWHDCREDVHRERLFMALDAAFGPLESGVQSQPAGSVPADEATGDVT